MEEPNVESQETAVQFRSAKSLGSNCFISCNRRRMGPVFGSRLAGADAFATARRCASHLRGALAGPRRNVPMGSGEREHIAIRRTGAGLKRNRLGICSGASERRGAYGGFQTQARA